MKICSFIIHADTSNCFCFSIHSMCVSMVFGVHSFGVQWRCESQCGGSVGG
jgi:hypothetical protein